MTVDIIQPPVHILSLTLTGSVPASGIVEVETGPKLPGEFWTIDYVAFEDETSAATDARLYTDGTFGRQYWRQWTTLAADTIYSELRQSLHLADGQAVGIRITGATSGDIVRLYLRGHRDLED